MIQAWPVDARRRRWVAAPGAGTVRMGRPPWVRIAWLSVAVAALPACESRDPATLVPAARSAATPVTPGDPLGPRYPSSLAAGILFARAGYPDFLADVYGMSAAEPWGRWTDGDTVVFRFRRPLPPRFVIELAGGAFGANVGRPVRLRVGAAEREVVFPGGPFDNTSTQAASFSNDAGSDTLTLLLPAAQVPPGGVDPRRLGLALTSLRVMER